MRLKNREPKSFEASFRKSRKVRSGLEDVSARIADHHDRLLFVALLNGTDRRGRRDGLRRLGQSQFASRHRAKILFDEFEHLLSLHIAKDGDDAILSDNILLLKRLQIGGSDLRHGFGAPASREERTDGRRTVSRASRFSPRR